MSVRGWLRSVAAGLFGAEAQKGSAAGRRLYAATDLDGSVLGYDGFHLEEEQISNARAYELVPSVYRAVDVIKGAIATLDLLFYRGDGNVSNSKRLPDTHPFVSSWHDAEDIEEEMSGSLDINGNAFLYWEPNKGRWDFQVLPAHNVRPRTDRKTGELQAWDYRYGGRVLPLPLDQVLHRRYYSVRGSILGQSPLSAAGLAFRIQRTEQRWVNALFMRGGEASGYFTTENQPVEPKMRRFELALKRRHQGPEAVGRPLMMPKGVKREPTMLTPEQLQFVEQYKLTKGDVYEVYGVPPWMVGIKDGGGLGDAGSKTDERIFWLHTVTMRTTRLERGITLVMRRLLGPDYFCAFDYSNVIVIKLLKMEVAKEAKAVTGRPAMTVNEYRTEFLGLAPLEGEEFDTPGTGTPEFGLPGLTQGAARATREAPPDDPRIESRRRHDARLTRYEMRLAAVVRALFAAWQQRVLAEIDGRQRGAARQFGDFHFTQEEAHDFLRELLSIVESRGVETMSDLGLSGFDLTRAGVREFVNQHGLASLSAIADTTRRDLTSALAENLGASDDVLKAAVESVFASRAGDALMIARTETAGYYNFATVEAWQQSGVVEAQTWITTMDGHARPEHEEADGQTVPIGEAFMVGGERARYPGDPALSPGNRINCRCGVEAVVSDEHRLRHIARWMESSNGKARENGHVHQVPA